MLRRLLIGLTIGFYVLCAGAASPEATVTPAPPDKLIPLLKADRFEEVSRLLRESHDRYEADRRTEDEFHRLASEFSRADWQITGPLQRWVKKSPNDPFAHLALGIHFAATGWSVRGSDWASNTNERQFTLMRKWFDSAKAGLLRAIELNPRLVEPYVYLIDIDMTEGSRNTSKLFNAALKINPSSLIAREAMLQSLLPRWGGSYEAMARLLEASQRYYKQMPRLELLESKLYADAGSVYFAQRNLPMAEKMFRQALAKGDFWFANNEYGHFLYRNGKYEEAAEQFTKVIDARPAYMHGWRMRANANIATRRLDEAYRDASRAIQIEPDDEWALAARGGVYFARGDLELALQDYKKALNTSPNDFFRERTITIGNQLQESKNRSQKLQK
ncbi:MAG: DUF4034 domain-containing protein [Hydrogenophaga sp.]|uniref:tetratricopeptide repeat protein n=1 Tax=Hydrogenophaga sp. TaxID=1904254 RepID=UPI001D338159|nr:DUF4034 domain-containing protein [Hydrogenophaga sp.]MBX3610067.1 DUF4034 domain-containing protein [Hydrogenophaga sp.]